MKMCNSWKVIHDKISLILIHFMKTSRPKLIKFKKEVKSRKSALFRLGLLLLLLPNWNLPAQSE